MIVTAFKVNPVWKSLNFKSQWLCKFVLSSFEFGILRVSKVEIYYLSEEGRIIPIHAHPETVNPQCSPRIIPPLPCSCGHQKFTSLSRKTISATQTWPGKFIKTCDDGLWRLKSIQCPGGIWLERVRVFIGQRMIRIYEFIAVVM